MNRVRIRDFLEAEEMLFSAVTYRHPPNGYNALLRYIRDPNGERERENGARYRKLNFREAISYIELSMPEYGNGTPHFVSRNKLKRIMRPKHGLKRLLGGKDLDLRKIVKSLIDYGATIEDLGITGSHLVGLNLPTSDIDFVAYGTESFERTRAALRRSVEDGRLEELNEELWRRIYKKRDPEIDFEEFLLHERRKFNKGAISGRYFDLLFVRKWSEIDGIPASGRRRGKEKIEARVTDDRFCFDSPAIYLVEHPTIDKVVSATHTYAGQVFKGEKLQAKGWIEEKGIERTLVVGTTRRAEGEWIKSLTLLEESL